MSGSAAVDAVEVGLGSAGRVRVTDTRCVSQIGHRGAWEGRHDYYRDFLAHRLDNVEVVSSTAAHRPPSTPRAGVPERRAGGDRIGAV